jgi:hypothetical protein
MTTPVEAVTSVRLPRRKPARTRKPVKRKRGERGLDFPDDDERDDAALCPGNEPKGDQ